MDAWNSFRWLFNELQADEDEDGEDRQTQFLQIRDELWIEETDDGKRRAIV